MLVIIEKQIKQYDQIIILLNSGWWIIGYALYFPGLFIHFRISEQ